MCTTSVSPRKLPTTVSAKAPHRGAPTSGDPMTRNIHDKRILILDFGSQYTQLIGRRVREAGVYCEILPWGLPREDYEAFAPRGIILSGGPESTTVDNAPQVPDYMFEAG